jgi:hypothetical protein
MDGGFQGSLRACRARVLLALGVLVDSWRDVSFSVVMVLISHIFGVFVERYIKPLRNSYL